MKILFLTFLSTILISASAQNHIQKNHLGFEIGYGHTQAFNLNEYFKGSTYKDFPNFLRIGIPYRYSLTNIINLSAGIDIDHNWKEDIRLTYLRIPAGFELQSGQKLKLTFGTGIFLSDLLFYKGISPYSHFEETKRGVQLGAYGSLGVNWQISENFMVELSLAGNIDITNLYDEYTSSLSGYQVLAFESRGIDSFLRLGYTYSF